MSRHDRVIDIHLPDGFTDGGDQTRRLGEVPQRPRARRLRGWFGSSAAVPGVEGQQARSGHSETREPLDAVEHVVGVGFVFPESRSARANVEYVTADVAAGPTSKSRFPTKATNRLRPRWNLRDRRSVARIAALATHGKTRTPWTCHTRPWTRLMAYVAIDEQSRQHLLSPNAPNVRSTCDNLAVSTRPLRIAGKDVRVPDITCLRRYPRFSSLRSGGNTVIAASAEEPDAVKSVLAS